MPVSGLNLRTVSLAELRASTLEDATIRAARIYTESDPAKLARLLNYDDTPSFCHGGAMVFRHFDAEGNPNCHVTVKPHQPQTDDKGKVRKYESPCGKPPQAYVGPASRQRMKAGAAEIVFVEGIKKALALEQLGYTVISLSGVYNWKVKGKEKLQPDLEGMTWAGLKVFICFDYDPKPETQRYVATAVRRLGQLLLKAGAAEVMLIALPPGPDNAKNGVDDHLAAFPPDQRAGVVRKMLDEARPIEYRFANYREVVVKDAKGNDKTIKVGRTAAEIHEDLSGITDGWPKRVDKLLFAVRDREPVWLVQTAELFAYIGSHLPQPAQWASGDDKVTQPIFHAHLQQQAECFKAVEAFPHCPPMPGHYYLPFNTTGGDGEHLQALLDSFCPATPADGQLIKAALLTLLWGGEPGSRPAFLIEADGAVDQGGRGPGKSTLVRMLARLVGGHLDIRATDDFNRTMNRLLSPGTLTKRVALLDNVKTLRFSWSDLEALVTGSQINGYQLYVGDASRPNTLTWFITMNGASMSKDMAQRCVPIKLARPKYSGDWEEQTIRFIEENRWAIIGDLLAVLAGPKTALSACTRWGTWEQSVLACVDEPEACQALIAERQAAIDGDQEDADLVREAFVAALKKTGHDPDNEVVFIRSKETAKIVNEAEETHRSPQRVTTYLLSLGIKELSKSDRSDFGGRGWKWTGPASTADAKVVLFGVVQQEQAKAMQMAMQARLMADAEASLRAQVTEG
jgi:hypothetical protein